MKVVELFAGIGGFRLGHNYETVFANDIDKHTSKVYIENFSNLNYYQGDLTNFIDIIPSHDILTGGFPCQPYSIAGKKFGLKDIERGLKPVTLILDILKKHLPKFIFFENVNGFITHPDSNFFFESLKGLGYLIDIIKCNLKNFGIPQNRPRCLIVGKYLKTFKPIELPKILHPPIQNYIEQYVDQKYYYHKFDSEQVMLGKVYQWRRSYLRENKSNLFPCFTANMGTGGHNVPIIRDKLGIRKITPRECLKLMGFNNNFILPISISDSNLYKMIGNSFSPVISSYIFKHLVD